MGRLPQRAGSPSLNGGGAAAAVPQVYGDLSSKVGKKPLQRNHSNVTVQFQRRAAEVLGN